MKKIWDFNVSVTPMVQFHWDDRITLFPHKITTERLVLKKVSPETTPFREFKDFLLRDEWQQVYEYVPRKTPLTPKDTFDWMKESQGDNGESATYTITPDKNETELPMAGVCGLKIDWDLSVANSWIQLDPQFWGYGYSTERGEAFLQLVFDELHIDVFKVSALPQNTQSNRAIEKYILTNGGERLGTEYNAHGGFDTPQDLVRYQIRADDWRNATR